MSSVTSASERPRRVTRTPARRVLSVATGANSPWRRCATRSERSSAGGPAGPAGGLDLRAGVVAARELQLPARKPVLDASSQRQPCAGERSVGCVVVGRGEDARLDRLAVERRQLEAAAWLELALAFQRRPHQTIVEPPVRHRCDSSARRRPHRHAGPNCNLPSPGDTRGRARSCRARRESSPATLARVRRNTGYRTETIRRQSRRRTLSLARRYPHDARHERSRGRCPSPLTDEFASRSRHARRRRR